MSYKVLLADDSLTIQKVVDLVLTHEGFELKIVDNGEHALKVLESFSPDIVLADIEMPKINGYQLCKSIKNHTLFSKIPVILLVGAFEPFDEQYAKAIGADDFIIKPFETEELIGKIKALLSRSDTVSEELFRPEVSSLKEHRKQSAEFPFISELNEFKKEILQQPSEGDALPKVQLPSKEEISKIMKSAVDENISVLVNSELTPQILSAVEDAVRKNMSAIMPTVVENITKEVMRDLIESLRNAIMRRLEELVQVWQKSL